MNNVLWEIQTILFKYLNQDNDLNQALEGEGKIFDYVPPNAPFPRLIIAECTANPWDSQTTQGNETLINLDIWAKEGGRKNITDIIHKTEIALSKIPKSHENIEIISLAIIAKETFRQTTSKYFRGIIRLRLLSQNKTAQQNPTS